MRRFGYLTYHFNDQLHYHHNIGDEIQTIAVLKLLGLNEKNTIAIGREQMAEFHTLKPPIHVVLNGWFINGTGWPPSKHIHPLFFGFHIARKEQSKFLTDQSISYLKQYEPIGCRDQGTKNLLESKGIQCFHSWCATLTLPKREQEPENGLVYIVIENKKLRKIVPRKLRKKALIVYHNIRLPCNIDHHSKLTIARDVYNTYKRKAQLIITDKIHCARTYARG